MKEPISNDQFAKGGDCHVAGKMFKQCCSVTFIASRIYPLPACIPLKKEREEEIIAEQGCDDDLQRPLKL